MTRVCAAVAAGLLLVAPAQADVSLANGQLAFDAFLVGRAVYWAFADQQWTASRFEFQRGQAQAGVTGRIGEMVSVRAQVDLAGWSLMDLYGDVRFANGLALRAGQFKLPVSFEMAARPERELLVDHTLAYNAALPAGPRDIGAMLSYRLRDRLEAHAGVVNGAGTGSDDYTWKDFFGRAVFRPVGGLGLGAGGYWGSRDSAAVRWMTGLVDAEYARGSLSGRAAGMYRLYKQERFITASVDAAYNFGFIEPVARFDMLFSTNEKAEQTQEFMPAAGLNFYAYEDRVRVMADFQYHKVVGKWLFQQLALRLQVSL
jgi:hypothetical protein